MEDNNPPRSGAGGFATARDRVDTRSIDREIEVLRFPFAPTPDAPRRARARTALVLGWSPHLDVVLVVVSELVTNAVLHTADVAELRVAQRVEVGTDRGHREVVRVEVADKHPDAPEVPLVGGANGGFGLRIVGAMARTWGFTPLPNGKIVWCEVGDRANAARPMAGRTGQNGRISGPRSSSL